MSWRISGGLSCPFVSAAYANEAGTPWYDPTKPQSRLLYIDKNSLYPEAMSMPLPIGGYESLPLDENDDWNVDSVENLLEDFDAMGDVGYFLRIDYVIPQHEHDLMDFAPISKMHVPWSELSQRQQLKAENKLHQQWLVEWERKHPGVTPPEHTVSEPRSANAVKKLVCWMGKHIDEGLTLAHVQLLRRLFDIEITKVYSIWKFKQASWAKPFIDDVSKRRAACTNELDKNCLKLTMNGNYGKLLQNQLTQTSAVLYTDPEAWQRAVWRKNYKDSDIVCYDENRGDFLAWCTTRKKKAVELTTLRLQGLVTLEWSKMLMLELHYDVIKQQFGRAAVLDATDTDSKIYHITLTEKVLKGLDMQDLDPEKITMYDVLNVMNQKSPMFDLSKCDNKELKRKCPYKGRIGFAKLEVGYDDSGAWQTLVAFLGAQAKMYALLIKQQCIDRVTAQMDQVVKMKAKGLPTRMLEKTFGWSDYEDAIYHSLSRRLKFRMMRPRNHVVEHLETSKIGITSNNEKVFQIGPRNCRCLGHYKNYLPGAETEDAEELWKKQ